MMDVDRAVVDTIPATSVALTLINLGGVCRPIGSRSPSTARSGRPGDRAVHGLAAVATGRPGPSRHRRHAGAAGHRAGARTTRRATSSVASSTPGPAPASSPRCASTRFGTTAAAWSPGSTSTGRVRDALEVDGHGHHATRTDRSADNARSLAMAALGILTVRLTYEQVCDAPERAVSTSSPPSAPVLGAVMPGEPV